MNSVAGINRGSSLALTINATGVLIWVGVFCLLFGYELFNFSLSIDEEVHTFRTGLQMASTWLTQGRWGMALLSLVLPPISALPVVSTAIFGAGMIYATAHLVAFYGIRGLQAHVFALVLLASPIWPHIVQFSPIAFGVGVAMLLCVLGVRLLVDALLSMQIVGFGLLVLAIGIYPTIAFGAVVMVLGRYLIGEVSKQGNSLWSGWYEVTRLTVFVFAATVLSLCVQLVALRVMGLEFVYVLNYWRIGEYLSNPLGALLISLSASADWIFGLHPIYMGYGMVFIAGSSFGLVCTLLRKSGETTDCRTLRAVCVLAIAIAVILPVFMAVGVFPARALVALPFMFALLATCVPLPGMLARRVMTVYLVIMLIFSMSTSATLFYSDHLMRERDRNLGADLVLRLEGLRTLGEVLPITLVGKLEPYPQEPIRQIEVFGASFFSWDQGNIRRVYRYLKILGSHNLQPVDIGVLPEIASKAEAMPVWPAKGSVALIDGVAVIKLSSLTDVQRYRLGAMHPGHPLGLPKVDIQQSPQEGAGIKE